MGPRRSLAARLHGPRIQHALQDAWRWFITPQPELGELAPSHVTAIVLGSSIFLGSMITLAFVGGGR